MQFHGGEFLGELLDEKFLRESLFPGELSWVIFVGNDSEEPSQNVVPKNSQKYFLDMETIKDNIVIEHISNF